MSTAAEAIAAIERGEVVVIPTDTVYGLAARGDTEAACRALYAVKGRATVQPTALVVASVDVLGDLLPELRGRPLVVARALLPGPFTLVLPNPGRRLPWLNGDRPDTIGIRVPMLAGTGREVLDAAGAIVATSANLPGGPDPRVVGDIPDELLSRVSAVVDGGSLPGTPSTVIDLTADEAVVRREGAVSASDALDRVARALTRS